MDRGAWHATVHGVARVRHYLATKPLPWFSMMRQWRQMSTCVSVCVCILVCTLYYYFMCSLSLQIYKIRGLKNFFSIFISVFALQCCVSFYGTASWISCCCYSVTQSCPTLCNCMDGSMQGFPVPHHLPEFAQVHVYCIGDAIQPSHPLTPSSLSALDLSQDQGLYQWVICSHHMNKILELQLQHQYFQWIFRVDHPQDWVVWSPCYPRDFQESSPAPQFEGISSLAFCLLYGPALTTIHDHWEDHSLDYTDLCQLSNVSAFQHTVQVCHRFPAEKQLSSDFMAAVTICSDFGTQEEEICHCFHLLYPPFLKFPSYFGHHRALCRVPCDIQ